MLKRVYKKIFKESFRLLISENKRKLKTFFFKGNLVECNCCQRQFSKFLPKGNGIVKRMHALCSNCGSLERTRILLMYLQNETSLFKSTCTLLHIAPENTLKKIFKNHANITYVNGDININLADACIDVTNIQYPDNQFDFIICSHVLAHVHDEEKAIQELFRVLKPNGSAFILTLLNKHDVPTYENPEIHTEIEKLNAYGENDLCRLHGNNFSETLRNPGFIVEKIDYCTQLENSIVERFKLNNKERCMIFHCKKIASE